MKNITRILMAAAVSLLAAACEEASAPFETVIPQRAITAPIKLATATYGAGDVITEGIIDNTLHTVTFQFEREGVDLSKVIVHMELISRAAPSTGFFEDGTIDLTEPYSFAVNNLEQDVVYTIYAKLPSFAEVDKSELSVLYGRTGDAPIQTNNGYGITFTEKELFDGSWPSGYQKFTDVGYHYFGWTTNVSESQRWFTFQSASAFKAYKMRIYPYWGFRDYDPAQFQIWCYVKGDTLPDATPSDWKTNGSWKLLADVDISSIYEEKIKALVEDSSLVGDPTTDPCVNGYEFLITDYVDGDIPASKFYRFVQVNNFFGVYKTELNANWGPRVGGLTLSELRVWKFRTEE